MTTRFLFATILLAAAVASTAAIPRAPKPWTIKFRTDWNNACVNEMTALVAKAQASGAKIVMSQVAIANFCDCSSDGMQQRYSEEEIMGFGDKVPEAFIQYSREVGEQCFNGGSR